MGSIKEELASQFRSLSVALTISTSVVFSVFAGAITGYYLDTWLFNGRTYPWLTIICLFFGIAGGIKNFLILSRRFIKKAGERKKDQPEEREGHAPER
ncbi:MAG: AtpZ/AtpI family protein [Deltaproteobacteria bacterium]|nr:AtpZ/AtpI family protein [Deltaproteobacteria bacterium]MBW1947479.1 AtpZ/AtpI family protein [Deltaproteobacteria bacterium]MBW1966635.1 AtpZ/AtpI family protein [Deltaproteobacteria bacterium]MBW2098837.1 AtpZ/AtpI family protein [Deltaproteobacteria bacterium]PXF53440.1 MAG: magnesium transporter [Deltaproteobacteria bacterium]